MRNAGSGLNRRLAALLGLGLAVPIPLVLASPAGQGSGRMDTQAFVRQPSSLVRAIAVSAEVVPVSDENDFYYYGAQRIRLNRSLTEVAVRFRDGPAVEPRQLLEGLMSSVSPGVEVRTGGRTFYTVTITLPDSSGAGINAPAGSLRARVMDSLRTRDEVEFVAPVFRHAETGIRMLPTDEVIVKLKAGGSREELAVIAASLGLNILKPMPGTEDEYVLSLDRPKTDDAVEKSRRP